MELKEEKVWNKTVFTCHCDGSAFNEHVILNVLEWCANSGASHDYDLDCTTSYAVHNFGHGLEEAEKRWTFELRFAKDADAIAFKLALDGLIAEATC